MSPAFVVVFALFVVALVAMIIAAVRWALRRDRAARQEVADRGGGPGTSPPATGPPKPDPNPGDTRSRLGDR